MRIGIQTWGSEGDIRPFLSLAGGLAARGHDVRLVLTSGEGRDYASEGARGGFAVESVASDYYVTNAERLAREMLPLFSTQDPIRQTREILEKMYLPVQEALFEASRRLAAACDVVVGHFAVDTVGMACELAGRPHVSVATIPNARSRHVMPLGPPYLGSWLIPFWWRVGCAMANRLFLPQANAFRARHGVPPIRDVLSEGMCSRRLNLVAVSRALLPDAPDWPPLTRLCGFLTPRDRDTAAALPAGLEDFLNAGEPPVYMTFGSMLTVNQPEEKRHQAVSTLLEAVRLAGVRAIVQAPWEGLGGAPEPSARLFPTDRTPHGPVFPRCSLVVHHGGAGTTQASLLAGRPSVVVPHIADQLYWAATVRRLGVSPRHVHRLRLTAGRLSRRIRAALDKPALTLRAEAAGRVMREEDGVATAARHIEGLFGTAS